MRILFEDNNNNNKIYTCGSDEFLIQDKRNDTTVRVSNGGYSQTVTSIGNHMVPGAVNGLSAFRIIRPDNQLSR